jgi:hypothetical protein
VTYGHEDDRRHARRLTRADGADHARPLKLRHRAVEQDQRDRVVPEELKGLDAIGSLDGAESGVVECPSEEATHGRLVVDDKYGPVVTSSGPRGSVK